MSYTISNPRENEYDLYLAAKDNSGNFSEASNVLIPHPGISKLSLNEGNLKGQFNSIKVILPVAYSVRSQTVFELGEVQDGDDPEKKEILGYRVYVYNKTEEGDASREDKLDNAEIYNFDIEETEDRKVVIPADSNVEYEIAVGCYDSVYHWEHNEGLYENTISDFQSILTPQIELDDIPDDLIEDSKLTETLRDNISNAYDYSTNINPGEIADNTQAINNTVAKFFSDAITSLTQNANSGDTTIHVEAVDVNIREESLLVINESALMEDRSAIVEVTSDVDEGDTSIQVSSLPMDLNEGAKVRIANKYIASGIEQTMEEISLVVEKLDEEEDLDTHEFGAIRTTYNQIDLTVSESIETVEDNLDLTGEDSPYDGIKDNYTSIQNNYGQIQINSDRITNTVSQIKAHGAVAHLDSEASDGDTILYLEDELPIKIREDSKIYLSDSDAEDNYVAILTVTSTAEVGDTSISVEPIPSGQTFSEGTGVRIADEYFATQVNQLADEYTVKIEGVTSEGSPISGGFGISVEEDYEEWIDFNILADKFRVFPTVTGVDDDDGQPVFGIDTEEGLVYFNADTTAVYSGFEEGEYDGVFELSKYGLKVDTANFVLDLEGNAEFIDGKIEASRFMAGKEYFTDTSTGIFISEEGKLHVGDDSDYIKFDQDLEIKTDDFEIVDGNGTFSGDITAQGTVHADAISSVNSGAITLAGDTIIDGSFEVSGGNVRITGNTTFEDDVTIKGTLDGVDGDFTELYAADGTVGMYTAMGMTFDYPLIRVSNEDGDERVRIQLDTLTGDGLIRLFSGHDNNIMLDLGGNGDGAGGVHVYDLDENRTIYLNGENGKIAGTKIAGTESVLEEGGLFKRSAAGEISINHGYTDAYHWAGSTYTLYINSEGYCENGYRIRTHSNYSDFANMLRVNHNGDTRVYGDLTVDGNINNPLDFVDPDGGVLDIKLHNLPDYDPEEEGRLYREGDTVKISQG